MMSTGLARDHGWKDGRAEHVLDMSISADTMIEIALRAFTTFFATIGPVDVAAVYAVLTATVAPSHRRGMAIKGTLIASILILLFILFGEAALRLMGITLSAVRASPREKCDSASGVRATR